MSRKKKKYDYFEAFQEQTRIALREADLLERVITNYDESVTLAGDILDKAHEIENEGDKVNHKTFKALATDFITPFDREDIIDISASLDDIIDQLEATMCMAYMMDVHVVHEKAHPLVDCIINSLQALLVLEKELPDFKKSSKFQHAVEEVNNYEEQADDVYLKAMRHLFAEESDDPIHVIKWSRIFDQLEDCCDACEHVSDVIETVVLKSS